MQSFPQASGLPGNCRSVQRTSLTPDNRANKERRRRTIRNNNTIQKQSLGTMTKKEFLPLLVVEISEVFQICNCLRANAPNLPANMGYLTSILATDAERHTTHMVESLNNQKKEAGFIVVSPSSTVTYQHIPDLNKDHGSYTDTREDFWEFSEIMTSTVANLKVIWNVQHELKAHTPSYLTSLLADRLLGAWTRLVMIMNGKNGVGTFEFNPNTGFVSFDVECDGPTGYDV
jgi:hypothetical protein